MTEKQMRAMFVGGGLVLGYLLYKGITEGGGKVLSAVNPADPENLVNRGTSAVVETASGGKFLSLGDALFNIFNPNAPGEDSFGKKLATFWRGVTVF